MSHHLNSHYYKHRAERRESTFGVQFSVSCKNGKRNKTTNLLQIEDVVVEIILQLLVCIVDAELLETVSLEVLKAKNVQDTDRQALENKSMNTDRTLMR